MCGLYRVTCLHTILEHKHIYIFRPSHQCELLISSPVQGRWTGRVKLDKVKKCRLSGSEK